MNKKTTYYSRLRTLLTSAFVILILVPTLFNSWVTVYNFRKCAVKKIEMALVSLAEHRSDVITKFLNHQTTLLSTLAAMYPLESMGDLEHLNQLFMAVNKSGDIIDLHVINLSGEQVAYVGAHREKVEGENYKTAPWLKDLINTGKHVSDVVMDHGNVPHLVIAVTDPLKTYVLRATINPEKFNSLLLRAQKGANGDAYIVNRLAEFQTPSTQGISVLPPEEKALLKFHEGTAVKEIGSFLYAARWLEDGQWLLIIKSKINDSLDEFKKSCNNSLLIIFCSSIIALIAGVLLIRHIVNKLERDDRRRADLDHQMIQVEKMATVGRLAAGIAHEINNPLQMITNQAGWIEELLPEEDQKAVKNFDEYDNAAKKIKSHVRRAGKITNRLLGFSRKISTEKEFVNINDLLKETVSFIENEANNNNVIIKQQLDENMVTTMTDGPQLQQVFLNLINNGLDAVGQDGQIDIRTRADDETIFIEVSDTGPGITSEVMQQMFDPFFTTKDPGKGTGLGLSICYDIMKKLGGAIKVKNRKPTGAFFTLTLPIMKLGKPSEGEREILGYDETIL